MSSPRTVLRDYWLDLVYGLTDVPMIVDCLYTDRVITAETMEALHREPNPQEQVRWLVTNVRKRSQSGAHTAFAKFLSALEKSGNKHFAELLREATRPPVPGPARSPPLQRSQGRPMPAPRPSLARQQNSGGAREEAVRVGPQNPRTSSGASTSERHLPGTRDRRESSSSSGSPVFPTGIDYIGSDDEREGNSAPSGGLQRAATPATAHSQPGPATAPSQPGPATAPSQPGPATAPSQPGPATAPSQPGPATAPSQPGPATAPSQPGPATAPSQPASLTGTGARPKQRPPGTGERRESSSSSDSDVSSTGITYTGSGDERQGLERKEKAGEDRRLGRRESTPEATSTANLPGLRSDVTRTLSDVTAQLSLSDQASAAPCLGAPRPAISRQAAPLPAASRIAASRPAASPPLSAPQVPALPSPLPRNVTYTTKRGPVCVVGPQLRKRFLFSSGVKLSGPARLAYHAGTDRLYVACCGNRQVVVCDTRGENAWVLYTVTGPRDVSVSGDGEREYVTGPFSLHILTASGRLVREVTSVPGGKLGLCWAVTCYQQQVAVLTGEPDRVVILSRDGEHVRTWSLGCVEGQGMAVDGDGRLYITDGKTGTVTVYSWEGEFRERFGEVDMENPWSPGICVDGDRHVCVSRIYAHRVDVYGPDRRLLTSLGGEWGDAPGQFYGPCGLCLLPDGRLVVSDFCNNSLQIF